MNQACNLSRLQVYDLQNVLQCAIKYQLQPIFALLVCFSSFANLRTLKELRFVLTLNK